LDLQRTTAAGCRRESKLNTSQSDSVRQDVSNETTDYNGGTHVFSQKYNCMPIVPDALSLNSLKMVKRLAGEGRRS